MRHTPYLDYLGATFKEDVPDHAVNIIDNALDMLSCQVEWGEWEGRKRKRCLEDPMLLTGMPLGQYHCPVCGMMVMAAMPHLTPAGRDDPEYPFEDYEIEYGFPWPAGYED